MKKTVTGRKKYLEELGKFWKKLVSPSFLWKKENKYLKKTKK
jgi:hypothetical protein